MPIEGKSPAHRILGLDLEGGAAALVEDGVLIRLSGAGGEGGWPERAVRQVLDGGPVEQVAVAGIQGLLAPLRRRLLARKARQALGQDAAFVGRGLVGTGLPRPWDRSDRLSLHPADRCRAAAAYYTAGRREALVLVEDEGQRSAWLGTSGKLVRLSEPGEAARVPVLILAGVAMPERPGVEILQSPLEGALALAAGAALLARADERQGAWVPSAWMPQGIGA